MPFLQRQFQLGLDILSASTAPAPGGSARVTEQVSKVKASGAAKATKIEIAEVEASRRRSSSCSLSTFPSRRRNTRAGLNSTPIFSVLIIEFAILCFGKYVISFLQLLELLFRSLVAGIQVGVKLAREFAIGLLDLIVGCPALDAEHLVVVFCLPCHRLFIVAVARPSGRGVRAAIMRPP